MDIEWAVSVSDYKTPGEWEALGTEQSPEDIYYKKPHFSGTIRYEGKCLISDKPEASPAESGISISGVSEAVTLYVNGNCCGFPNAPSLFPLEFPTVCYGDALFVPKPAELFRYARHHRVFGSFVQTYTGRSDKENKEEKQYSDSSQYLNGTGFVSFETPENESRDEEESEKEKEQKRRARSGIGHGNERKASRGSEKELVKNPACPDEVESQRDIERYRDAQRIRIRHPSGDSARSQPTGVKESFRKVGASVLKESQNKNRP